MMRDAKALVASLLALCLCAAALAGCGGDPYEGVAARYGADEVIYEQEVEDYTAQFRGEHGYDSDEAWASYLNDQGLTAQTWRTQAIGEIAEQKLVEDRARELGITADENLVEAQIAADKRAAGVAEDDEGAWQAYLASRGMTQEAYRENLEKASVRYALLKEEVKLDSEKDEAQIDEYIQDNLVSRVVRRYRMLGYDTPSRAQAALDRLEGLSGEQLLQEFAALADEDDSDETTLANGGDVGWDIANDWGTLQQELNDEMLEPQTVSDKVHRQDGTAFVVLCTARFVFDSKTTYDALPDDELKAAVRDAALYDSWGQLTAAYLAQLREEAHIQVKQPE